MKVYVIGHDYEYANWLEGDIVNYIEDADLVMLTGGEDWHPSWYSKDIPHQTVHSNIRRDEEEMKLARYAISLNKKMIGICRGSQGGCILAGGELIQHQDNLGYIHPMKTCYGQEIQVTSTHHQAAFPFRRLKEGVEFKLLGWTNSLKCRYLSKNEIAPKTLEAEVVYYPKINFLGIQPHPEHVYKDYKYINSTIYFQNLVKTLMEGKL